MLTYIMPPAAAACTRAVLEAAGVALEQEERMWQCNGLRHPHVVKWLSLRQQLDPLCHGGLYEFCNRHGQPYTVVISDGMTCVRSVDCAEHVGSDSGTCVACMSEWKCVAYASGSVKPAFYVHVQSQLKHLTNVLAKAEINPQMSPSGNSEQDPQFDQVLKTIASRWLLFDQVERDVLQDQVFNLGRNTGKLRHGARWQHEVSLYHGARALRNVGRANMQRNALNGLPLPTRSTLLHDRKDSLIADCKAKSQYGLRSMDRLFGLAHQDLTISFDEVALNQRMTLVKVSNDQYEVMGHVQHCSTLAYGVAKSYYVSSTDSQLPEGVVPAKQAMVWLGHTHRRDSPKSAVMVVPTLSLIHI